MINQKRNDQRETQTYQQKIAQRMKVANHIYTLNMEFEPG